MYAVPGSCVHDVHPCCSENVLSISVLVLVFSALVMHGFMDVCLHLQVSVCMYVSPMCISDQIVKAITNFLDHHATCSPPLRIVLEGSL